MSTSVALRDTAQPREITSLEAARAMPLGVAVANNFDILFDTFLGRIQGGAASLSAASLVTVVMSAIQLAEQVGADDVAVSGAVKKALVLRLVERLINVSCANADARQTLLALLSQMGPTLIDGLISADNGELIRRAKSGCATLFSGCLGKK
jgi:hypothetical protein